MSQPLLASLFDETERRPVSVSELTTQIRGTLEKRFASVWVEGEISNFRAHSSGHWYFTLKDEFAQLKSACYRSSNQRIRFRLEDGMQVRARGRLSVYEPKGEYQLIAESIEPVGAGALQLAFEQTKARLQAEGLFAPELKRAIPIFPQRVGVVTSAKRRGDSRHPARPLATHAHGSCPVRRGPRAGRGRATRNCPGDQIS